jgi:hypothetical protein
MDNTPSPGNVTTNDKVNINNGLLLTAPSGAGNVILISSSSTAGATGNVRFSAADGPNSTGNVVMQAASGGAGGSGAIGSITIRAAQAPNAVGNLVLTAGDGAGSTGSLLFRAGVGGSGNARVDADWIDLVPSLNSGVPQAMMGVNVQGDLNVTGAKAFVQPHPTDPSKALRFVCLEGNESGTYFRGTGVLVNGRAVIEVPEEFRLVTEDQGLTVQVTPLGAIAALAVESKDLDQIVVVGSRNVEFDYFVNGVRKGFAGAPVVIDNRAFVPEVRGVPFGLKYPAALREVLVQNGTLNPDFTPNEATASRLGWKLRESQDLQQQ